VPAFEIGRRRALKFAERRAGELKEGFVVLLQRFGRERREGLAEAGFRSLQQGDLFG
jgi:hypothetical protein